MGIAVPAIPYPRIHDTRGKDMVSESFMVKMSADDDHDTAIMPGSWLFTNTNGQEGMATAAAAASYIVMKLFDANLNALPFQYVTADQLDAADYYAIVHPVGGITFIALEDADTTPIPDSSQFYYADLIVGTPIGASEANKLPFGAALPNIKIDSTTANSSSSGLLIQLMGVAPGPDNRAYSATTLASPRAFLFKVIDAAATSSI